MPRSLFGRSELCHCMGSAGAHLLYAVGELLQGENQGICIAPMAPVAVPVSGEHVLGAGSGGVPQHQL